MTRPPLFSTWLMRRWWALLLLSCLCVGGALAQEAAPRWNQLTPPEREVLLPLREHWPEVDAVRKQKWREVALRYPGLPVDQQSRIRERMLEWAGMTAAQRTAARMQYQSAKKLPMQERQARWEAYQALPEEQRRALAGKAQSRSESKSSPQKFTGVDEVQPKSNIVSPPAKAPAARAVGPGTVQASVGASTRPITQRPRPPLHQQIGQPKIAATPEFVDPRTLLPRGPHTATEPARTSQ
ncbi:MAG: DUF3106 domain-containing protein [Burkholderiales bacterium]